MDSAEQISHAELVNSEFHPGEPTVLSIDEFSRLYVKPAAEKIVADLPDAFLRMGDLITFQGVMQVNPLKANYRWWTLGAGKIGDCRYLKLGPVTLSRTVTVCDDCLRSTALYEFHWLNRALLAESF